MPQSPTDGTRQLETLTVIHAQKQASCKRCHQYKEKCTYTESQKACCRCTVLAKECRPRIKKRMGRPPVAQQLPYGATSIILLAKSDQNVETGPISEYQKGDLCGSIGHTKPHITSHHSLSKRVNSRLLCPKKSALSDATASADLALYNPPNFRTLRPPLRSSQQVNYVLESADGFFAAHQPFMLGKSFLPEFHSVVRRLFVRSPQILTDAYAVALNLLSSRHATSRKLDEQDLAIGAHCLQRLMGGSASITRPEDAAVVLLLGQALLVYNALIPSPDTQIITRGTLLSVRHWYPALLQRSDLNAVTMTPVLMDTVECLIRREVPVIQLPPPDYCVVDRFAGLRSSLLPLLYELCDRSYHAKIAAPASSVASLGHVENDPYFETEDKIRRWNPELPPDFFTAYSAWEANVMLVQARCYRIAALLVIHRLRFPLGMENNVAHSYANNILQDLSRLKTWPPDAATGLGLDFPLLVATLELPGPGIEIYIAFEQLRFRRQHSDEILKFIQFVNTARESGFRGLWFDLVQDKLLGLTLT